MTIYIPQHENIDGRKFDLIVATKNSSIFMGKFYVDDKGQFNTIKSLKFMLSFKSQDEELDEVMTSIKVINSANSQGVIGVTSTRMYQFWGSFVNTLRDILLSYQDKDNLKDALSKVILDPHYKRPVTDTFNYEFKPKLSIMVKYDDTVQSIGWQAESGFLFTDFRKKNQKLQSLESTDFKHVKY